MRPLRLVMTAFGPFPGREVINFEAFGVAPLFLINGPTGSGKTTILDAICFALYGKTTGDEREGAQMRSDLAAAEVLCEVEFSFLLHDRHFEIRRVPEQLRPKARGDGLTEQKPEAQLAEILADGSKQLLVSSKVSEATREIESLTGLSADQFRQVMVLPQGKFRQLLLAESVEREKIFSQLFQTGIYKRLEERLREKSAAIRREREACLQQRQGILEAVECDSAAAVDREISDLQGQVDAAREIRSRLETAYLAAHQDFGRAQALVNDFEQLSRVAAELVRLNQRESEITELKKRVAAAIQADRLRPVFLERDRCLQEQSFLAERLTETRATLTRARERLRQVEAEREQLPHLNRERDDQHLTLRRMEQYREGLERMTGLDRQLEDLQRQSTLYGSVRRLAECDQQLARLNDYSNQKRVLENLKKKLEQVEAEGLKLKQKYDSMVVANKTLELAWHQGQAALLAAELQDGAPCPVCGSQSHPAPAATSEHLPSYQELEGARKTVAEQADRLEAVRDQFRELRAEVKQQGLVVNELEAGLGPDPAAAVAQLKAQRAIEQQALEGFPAADVTTLRQLDSDALSDSIQKMAEKQAVIKRERELLGKDLPLEFRDLQALESATRTLIDKISRCEKRIEEIGQAHREAYAAVESASNAVQQSEQQHGQALIKAEAAARACHDSLVGSPFAAEEDYRAALLSEAELDAFQSRIDSFEGERLQLSGADRELRKKLEGQERPDLDMVERQFRAAEKSRTQADHHWRSLDSRLQALQNTRKKLDANQARLKELDDRYRVVGTVSDVASGQTGQKVSLQRFVLSVLLDDVLLEASTRLTRMSKGRYRLLRKEDRAKGNKASGLDLLVDDAYTGKVRPVATLSGGESFMAALALALGLSDIVQAYSGGVRLDTLFIDEGFGSLDPESLDLAIRTLVDLQSAGRMIGIISHVGDLKEQIPQRIDVVQQRTGSTVRLVPL